MLARVGNQVIRPPDERLFITFSTSLSHIHWLYSLAGFSISLSRSKQTHSVIKRNDLKEAAAISMPCPKIYLCLSQTHFAPKINTRRCSLLFASDREISNFSPRSDVSINNVVFWKVCSGDMKSKGEEWWKMTLMPFDFLSLLWNTKIHFLCGHHETKARNLQADTSTVACRQFRMLVELGIILRRLSPADNFFHK